MFTSFLAVSLITKCISTNIVKIKKQHLKGVVKPIPCCLLWTSGIKLIVFMLTFLFE